MSDINQVCLTGHIGKNPEIKYFESGHVVVNFSVAVSEWAGQNKGEITYWFDCRAWGRKAEFIGEYAKSGSLVMINGRLAVDSYKAQDGTNRTKTYINVDEIKVVEKKQS
jgi:single-strand DNA-binding protein